MSSSRAKKNKPKHYAKSKKEMTFLQRAWHFIWREDSLLSWLANIVLAFILIKFVVYPLLALALGSSLPVVAVITSSMDQSPTPTCLIGTPEGFCIEHKADSYMLCGEEFTSRSRFTFDEYWDVCGDWYEQRDISQTTFASFPLSKGFNRGDVIVLGRADPEQLAVGDILVFNSNTDPSQARPYPIIHRIVDIRETATGNEYITKGDHNHQSIQTDTFDETSITEEQIIGRGLVRIPYAGYVKLIFVDVLRFIGLGGY
jgi:signal peptidase I